MKNIKLFVVILTLLLLLGVFAYAKPNFAPAIVNPSGKSVVIPSHAVELAPGVFSLGTAVDKGRVVEGFAFVDYKKEQAKPLCNNDGICGRGENKNNCANDCGNGGTGGESTCFAFLAKDAKWKTVEDYIVDPTNIDGLDENFVKINLALDIAEWEDAADGADILGDEVPGIVDGADTLSPDNKNEVMFGDIASPGAIAVTIVWGIFNGPPFARELVEWDQVYDDVDFDWSADCLNDNCTNKMDFENIAQHELGHSIGMGHPSDTCTEETMFRFASNEETNKRTLNDGDIAGVQEFYA